MFRKLILVVIVVLTGACATKVDSVGDFDEIFVFADSTDWQDYRDALGSHFMKEYLTPVPEEEYLLLHRKFKDFNAHKNHRNIMMIARLDGKDPVSQEIIELLSPEIIEGVKNGDYFFIPQENVWARNQYVVFIVAPDKETLIQRSYDLGELVYDNFETSYYQRLRKNMFDRGENEKLEEYISRHFPFTLRVQHDYKLVDESLDERYIWLRRIYPDRDRSLTVRWIPGADSINLTKEWLIGKRNELAAKIHSGDVIVEEETIAEQTRFNRWSALRLEGTWMNPKMIIGGPFRTIAFKDSETNNVYIIDFYVQAIGERKKPYLDQLDIIAHTFRLDNDQKG